MVDVRAVQEVRDNNSSVTPCIVMKNDGVMYHQMLRGVPENILIYTHVHKWLPEINKQKFTPQATTRDSDRRGSGRGRVCSLL